MNRDFFLIFLKELPIKNNEILKFLSDISSFLFVIENREFQEEKNVEGFTVQNS